MEYGIWSYGDSRKHVWSMEYGVWNTEYGIRSMEYGVWNTEYGVRNTEYGVTVISVVLQYFYYVYNRNIQYQHGGNTSNII